MGYVRVLLRLRQFVAHVRPVTGSSHLLTLKRKPTMSVPIRPMQNLLWRFILLFLLGLSLPAAADDSGLQRLYQILPDATTITEPEGEYRSEEHTSELQSREK